MHFRRLTTIASPLLALALGGVAWGSLAAPGVTGFVEIEGNVRFDGFGLPLGTCEGGTNAGAPCAPHNATCTGSGTPLACCTGSGTGTCDTDCNSNNCVKYDWAKGPTDGCATSATGVVTCAGTNGLFDGGKFNGATATPTPPNYIQSDPTIVAHSFGVDELGINSNVAGACSLSATPCVVGSSSTTNCPSGETCVNCGGGDPTVYTGQGSETNDSDLNGDTFNTATVPNKDDISNVYAIAHQDPPFPSTSSSSNINELFAAFERVVNNGDSHVDLEFLQGPLKLIPNAGRTAAAKFPCQGRFQGHRSAGDLLLSVDFTTGGTFGTSTLRQWQCNGSAAVCAGGSNDGMSCSTQSNCPSGRCECDPGGKSTAAYGDPVSLTFCNGGTNGGAACTSDAQCTGGGTCQSIVKQAVNASGAVSCGGWACRNAGGNQTTSLPTNEFYEVGIDLAKAGFTGCISTFLPHTRSSQSFTAVLKDFALLGFNTCLPTTKLTKTASSSSVTTGGSVTYTYTETNDGNVPLTSPCPNLTDKRSCFVTDDTCTTVTYATNQNASCTGTAAPFDCCTGSGTGTCGDVNNNNTLDPAEQWVFTCTLTNITSDTTNTARGHGIFNGKDVTYCGTAGMCGETAPTTPPANTLCDQDECAQATVTVLTPSTKVQKSVQSTSVQTTIVYNYTEENDGSVALTPPGGTSDPASAMVDPDCTNHSGTMTFVSGDTSNAGVLDPGETWHFTCTATYSGTGPFTDTATGHGCFTSGGNTKDVTFGTAASACGSTSTVFPDSDERDTKCVSLTCNACTTTTTLP